MATRKKRAAKRAAKKSPARRDIVKRAVAKKAAKASRASTSRKSARSVAKKPAGKTGVARRVRPLREKVATPHAKPALEAVTPSIDPLLFPCGDEALRAATGKDWNEWLALLDASGAAAKGLDHHGLLELTMKALPETAGWWAQMVSVGYERARGLREKHESCNGEFQATVSKTFPVPLFAAFASWADANLRGQWLDAPDLSFTKLNAGRNIRARWPDGSLLDIRFNATGPDRCQIVVDTMKLDDGEAVQRAKAFWQAQFERLQQYFNV